jgi:hypothetical protein
MTTDARRALVRRIARSILTRAHVILLERRALEAGEAFARTGSEAGILARPDAYEAERLRGIRHAPDASA